MKAQRGMKCKKCGCPQSSFPCGSCSGGNDCLYMESKHDSNWEEMPQPKLKYLLIIYKMALAWERQAKRK